MGTSLPKSPTIYPILKAGQTAVLSLSSYLLSREDFRQWSLSSILSSL